MERGLAMTDNYRQLGDSEIFYKAAITVKII
jgi:hypothetical protein